MSTGEIAYLAMVLTAVATFMGVMGFISVWSRRGKRPTAAAPLRADRKADMWDAPRSTQPSNHLESTVRRHAA